MGTYLSTPITDKGKESGEALECPAAPLVWGVVDMQGWRKSMEDSHVAQTNVAVPPHLQTDQDHDAKVFGVFDGHGGSEVARFTQLYLVDVLTKQPTWVEAPDEDPAGGGTTSSLVGQALVDTFHALDRMIDQPERRDELIRLRGEKPQPGEQKTVSEDLPIPPEKIHHSPADVVVIGNDTNLSIVEEGDEKQSSSSIIEMLSNAEKSDGDEAGKGEEDSESPATEVRAESNTNEAPVDAAKAEVDSKSAPTYNEKEATETEEVGPKDSATEANDDNMADEQSNDNANGTTAVADEASTEADHESASNMNGSAKAGEEEEAKKPAASEATTDGGEVVQEKKADAEDAPALKEEPKPTNDTGAKEGDTTSTEDDDSNAAVGKEDAAKLDQDLMLEDSDNEKEEEPAEVTNRKVTIMFQKLLNLGGNSGQMSLRIADKAAEVDESESDTTDSPQPQGIVPTIIQNGRQICNLPDHPIHAGCTAIVAVLIGRKLTVANAGDSRAVLCRAGGRAEALSFDHKPSQDRELTRINNAGGFVNQFGRVNGNLNLSRSIGDLKYKQVPGIHPESQMITAEPDIVEVYLQSNDEFVILGCDGIWDCLTNNQAVKYVRERIDTLSPVEIGVQMLDEIISDDPRATQGIGGDNMTVMIIDLQPSKRSYRNEPPSATDDDTDGK